MPTGLRVTTVAGAAGLLLAGACAQLLDVQDIPPEAGVDASIHHDGGGKDAAVEAEAGRHDGAIDGAVDARKDRSSDAPGDAWHDAGRCGVVGTQRCTADGLGYEVCEKNGAWSAPTACVSPEPVCLLDRCVCAPGDTRCAASDAGSQRFQRCVTSLPGDAAIEGGYPGWSSAATLCPGTCNIEGCGPIPPSCAVDGGGLGVVTCGDLRSASCCTSNEVFGGVFMQSYDGIPSSFTAPTPAQKLSPFRLDRFEVTVGRFQQFVHALSGGFLPETGSGKHAHVNGGRGLNDQGADGGTSYEQGWDPADNADLKNLAASPGASLSCGAGLGTYQNVGSGAGNELPINCVTWAEAYAFCIWDGGFLPTEAEWNFAAAGGSDQRYYPWSIPLSAQELSSPEVTATCKNANFTASASNGGACNKGNTDQPAPAAVGFSELSSPGGDSRWGQADMAGNVVEWTLDYFWDSDASTCTDCARTSPPPRAKDAGPIEAGAISRVQRGGSYVSDEDGIRVAPRGSGPQDFRSFVAGIRCARTP